MARVCLAVEAMRSRFELVLDGEIPETLQAAGEEAIREILHVERLLNSFDPSSDLGRVNRAAVYSPVAVAGATGAFLQEALRLAKATDGAFDLTATSGGGSFALDEGSGTVTLLRKGTHLDPGALGKGWALDRSAELLREAGVTQALLHAGTSSVAAIGSPSGEIGWMVAVCDPADSTRQIALLRLRDDSLSVSGNHTRSHIVDPRTGTPVVEARLAVVRAASATEAEALSTALLVLGPEGVPLLESRFPEASLRLYL